MLGLVDGLLGIALPFAVLALVAVIAWAGAGGPGDWASWIRAAAVVQLLGHGVDVRFDAPGGAFTATAGLLGPALVTAGAAWRAGRRAAGTASPLTAWLAGALAAAAASTGLLGLASTAAARPEAWQAVLLPTGLVAVVSLLALRAARPGSPALPAPVRAGVAAAALLVGAAAVLTAVLLLVRFADVVALYEGLAAGPVGGFALTAGQLLVLPAAVVWAAAWTTGAGVALGTGSASGPFATQVGPLPGVPLLGVVPPHPGPIAAAVLLVPVLAGFAAAALARRSGVAAGALPLGAGTGAVAGLLMALAAASTSGAAGPGRFAAVGPDPVLTGLLAAVEIGLPAMLAAAVLRPRPGGGPVQASQ